MAELTPLQKIAKFTNNLQDTVNNQGKRLKDHLDRLDGTVAEVREEVTTKVTLLRSQMHVGDDILAKRVKMLDTRVVEAYATKKEVNELVTEFEEVKTKVTTIERVYAQQAADVNVLSNELNGLKLKPESTASPAESSPPANKDLFGNPIVEPLEARVKALEDALIASNARIAALEKNVTRMSELLGFQVPSEKPVNVPNNDDVLKRSVTEATTQLDVDVLEDDPETDPPVLEDTEPKMVEDAEPKPVEDAEPKPVEDGAKLPPLEDGDLPDVPRGTKRPLEEDDTESEPKRQEQCAEERGTKRPLDDDPVEPEPKRQETEEV
jgi:hypothetical protein